MAHILLSCEVIISGAENFARNQNFYYLHNTSNKWWEKFLISKILNLNSFPSHPSQSQIDWNIISAMTKRKKKYITIDNIGRKDVSLSLYITSVCTTFSPTL